jgi:hypothetical protein
VISKRWQFISNYIPYRVRPLPIVASTNFQPTNNLKEATFIISGIYTNIRPLSWLEEGQSKSIMELLVYAEVNGERVLVVWLKHLNFYVAYIYVDALKHNTPKTNARVGSTLSGNMKPLYAGKYKGDWYARYDSPVTQLELPTIQVARKQFLREKITQGHHTLIRPEEVISVLYLDSTESLLPDGKIAAATIKGTDERSYVAKRMLYKAQQLGIIVEASIATFLLFIALTNNVGLRVIHEIIDLSETPEEFRDTLKEEGLVAKQMQHWFRNDLSHVFELNVLFNRIDKEVDWDEEKRSRVTEVETVNISEDYVYQQALSIFAQAAMNGQKPHRLEWADYWDDRWAKMPTGSFVSQYPEDIADKKKLVDPRLMNKTTVLSSVGDRDFSYYSVRNPMIYATVSTKYEWDKVRALYGCDITSYLMADFSMGTAEECLPPYFPVGRSAEENNVTKIMERMSNGVPLCYDYENFNAQHSKKSMQMVIKAWGDIFGRYLTNDQRTAVAWTYRSIDKLVAKFGSNEMPIEVLGTLFSGWRHTSFMNTVLNRIYLMWAGLEGNVLYSIHNGDDVFAELASIKQGMYLIQNARDKGIKAQISKMSIGTIGEFLRVDGMATDKTAAQYLTRACTTAVHSRIESEAAISLRAALDATRDRMQSLVSRGADSGKIIALEKWITKKITIKLFDTSEDVTNAYYRLHLVQGGGNYFADIQNTRLLSDEIIVDDQMGNHVAELMEPGSQAYLNHLARKFDVPIDQISRQGIRKINKAMAKTIKTTLRLEKEDRKYVKYYRTVFKVHKEGELSVHLSKVRLLGEYNVATGGTTSKHFIQWLKKQENPGALISIMT